MTTTELSFAESMERRGWRFLKNGWPDFLFYNPMSGKSFAVEFKSPGDKLRPEQVEMHKWLRASGLVVYVASYDFDPTSVLKNSLMTPGAVRTMMNNLDAIRKELTAAHQSLDLRIQQAENQLKEAVILNEQ